MINDLRVADEEKMLRELRRLSRKGHDLQFRGRRGETPVIARRRVLPVPVTIMGLLRLLSVFSVLP